MGSSRSTRSLSRGGSRNESLLETLLTRSAIVHHEQETLQSKDKSLNKSTSQPQAIANAAKRKVGNEPLDAIRNAGARNIPRRKHEREVILPMMASLFLSFSRPQKNGFVMWMML